jgi:hypothetical protein
VSTRALRGAARSGHVLAIGSALAFLAVGCASYTSVSERTSELLRRGDYAGALGALDRVSKGSDRLLVELDRGLVLHYRGAYDSSNVAFEAAERLIDESYTKSLSAEAFSFLTSDNVRAYEGASFEHVMVPVYRALNYVALGRRDDALVEARKASAVLGLATRDLDEPAYGDDPFVQYFTGLLYEWGGELNDAYVSLRRAEEVYREGSERGGPSVPSWLASDLVRVASRLGFHEDVTQWEERYPPTAELSGPPAGHGEVILVLEKGFVPGLTEARLDLPILKTDSKKEGDAWHVAREACARPGHFSRGDTRIAYWLSLAYPLFPESKPVRCTPSLSASDALVPFELVSDVTFNARRSYDDRQSSVLVRTAARAVLKAVAKKQADSADPALGVLVNVIGALTEHADLRSWRTLPSDIWMARIALPAGEHDLDVAAGPGTDGVTLEGVVVRPGERTWVSYRLF